MIADKFPSELYRGVSATVSGGLLNREFTSILLTIVNRTELEIESRVLDTNQSTLYGVIVTRDRDRGTGFRYRTRRSL